MLLSEGWKEGMLLLEWSRERKDEDILKGLGMKGRHAKGRGRGKMNTNSTRMRGC